MGELYFCRMQEIIFGNKNFRVEQTTEEGLLIINSQHKKIDALQLSENTYHLLIDGKSYTVEVVNKDAIAPEFKVNGKSYKPKVKTETDLLLERLGMNIKTKKEVKELKAPMPGLIVEYRVEIGQKVNEGDPLVVLEAMKMENILKAPNGATIKSIDAQKGDAIEKNQVLITFE